MKEICTIKITREEIKIKNETQTGIQIDYNTEIMTNLDQNDKLEVLKVLKKLEAKILG